MASSPTNRPQLPTARRPGAPAGGPTPFWRNRGFWIYLVVLLLLNYVISIVFTSGPSRMTVPYTTFIQQVNADNVKDITAQGNSIQGDFKNSVTYGSASGTLFQTERPVFAQDNLAALLEQHNVPITATPPGSGQSPLLNLLLSFGPALLLIGGFLYLSRRMQTAGPGGILGAFGRSSAFRHRSSSKPSSGLARPAFATSSPRQRRLPRASSSSMSWTRSDVRALRPRPSAPTMNASRRSTRS